MPDMVLLTRKHRRHDARGPDFAGLMAMFDANYTRLGWLCPTDGVAHRSRAQGSPDLYAQVLERHPYTTELRLTYFFERGRGTRADPDARLRIYHDARQAEIMSCRPGRSFRRLHGPWVPSPDEMHRRWTLNRFLAKWLDYLLAQGHAIDTFHPVKALPRAGNPGPGPVSDSRDAAGCG